MFGQILCFLNISCLIETHRHFTSSCVWDQTQNFRSKGNKFNCPAFAYESKSQSPCVDLTIGCITTAAPTEKQKIKKLQYQIHHLMKHFHQLTVRLISPAPQIQRYFIAGWMYLPILLKTLRILSYWEINFKLLSLFGN